MNKQRLSENWKEIELGNILTFEKKSDIKAGDNQKEGKYKFFTSSNIQSKFINKAIFDGEYLIFSTGGSAGIHYCNDKFSTSTDCFVVKVNNELLPNYVYYYLFTNIHVLEAGFKGAGLKHISKEYIKKIKIIYPENNETQQKIVSILEKVEKAKEMRKEADELTKNFLKAVFMEMFGDPNTNGKKWKKVSTIEVCEYIVPGRDKPKSFTGDTPWITTEDLHHLGKTDSSQKGYGLSKKEMSEVRARIIPKNSVILTCVGNLGIVSVTSKEVVINQQLHAFICSEKIHPIFLMYNLSVQTDYMYRMATSTTVPYMNKTVCNSIPTILPPIELQNKFASIVKEMESMKDQQKHSKEQIDNLFHVLMQKAFKGELEI